MRSPDNYDLCNRRVRRKRRLDLAREDILASRDVHLLLSSTDAEETGLIAHRKITGVKPSVVAECFSGSLDIMEISTEHLRSAQLQLSGLVEPCLDAVVLHETHFEKRNRPSNFSRVR